MPLWDNTTKDKLRALWTEGKPTRQIAEELRTTNGAVAGQARRLGLPFRTGAKAEAGHSVIAKRAARKRHKAKSQVSPFGSSKVFEKHFAKIEEKMLAADAGRIGVPILIVKDGLLHANPRLDFHCCKWPIDGGFCGRDAVKGISYCEPHAKRASNVPIRIAASAIPPPRIGQLLLFNFLEPIARRYEAA